MLEQMENESGNVVLSHARPAALLLLLAVLVLTLFLSPSARVSTCVCERDYLHCHTFIIVSVLLRYLLLCSALQAAQGSGHPRMCQGGGVSEQTAAAQLHYPASADGWLPESWHPCHPVILLFRHTHWLPGILHSAGSVIWQVQHFFEG